MTSALYVPHNRKRAPSPRQIGAVLVGFTVQEREIIRTAAASCGQPVATWIRGLAFAEVRKMGLASPAQQKAPRRTTEST